MSTRPPNAPARIFVPVALVGCLAQAAAAGDRQDPDLPPAIARAVREYFPHAIVRGVDRDRETGVEVYEVTLWHETDRIEVKFDRDGGMGEVESVVHPRSVPPQVLEALRREIGDHGIERIEKHERWGTARDGRFAPLDEPRIFYEAEYRLEGRWKELTVRYRPAEALPSNVRDRIAAAFPGARIRDAQVRRAWDQELHAVVLSDQGRVRHVSLSPEGLVTDVSAYVEPGALPAPVGQAIRDAAPGARVTGIQQVQLRAVVGPGKITPLEEARDLYRAHLVRGNRVADMAVLPDGTIDQEPQWRTLDAEDDDEEDED